MLQRDSFIVQQSLSKIVCDQQKLRAKILCILKLPEKPLPDSGMRQ
jgi:hypothetical protein